MPLPYASNDLRRTVSTLDVNPANSLYPVRESQSFTNGTRPVYPKQIQDEKSEVDDKQGGNNVCFICTRQVYSEEPFYVYEQMLKYHGEKYTEKDIAPVWKKDCRMWLWKTSNNSNKINKKQVMRKSQKSKSSLSKIFQQLSLRDGVATISNSLKSKQNKD